VTAYVRWRLEADIQMGTDGDGQRRPLLVKSAVLAMRRLLPVFPDKQTFSVFVGMSQTCQTRTSFVGA